MLRSAIITLAILVGPSLQQAHTQTPSSTEQLQDFAGWIAQLREATEAMQTILGPVEQAEIVFHRFQNAEMSFVEAQDAMGLYKDEVITISQTVRNGLASLPRDLETDSLVIQHVIESVDEVLPLIDRLEETALASIDGYATAMTGDVDATIMLDLLAIDRAAASIEVSNTILKNDLAAISTTGHPQLSLVRCMIASNTAVLHLLNARREAIDPARPENTGRHIRLFEGQVLALERNILDGRRNQAETLKRLRTAWRKDPLDDQDMMRAIETMIQAYDEAWVVEEEIVAEMNSAASILGESDTFLEADNELMGFYDKLTHLEERRIQLLFDRIAIMER
ncbi:MAG: hypothetical protein AAFW65_02730 [Pseudomonadota bacterium]